MNTAAVIALAYLGPSVFEIVPNTADRIQTENTNGIT